MMTSTVMSKLMNMIAVNATAVSGDFPQRDRQCPDGRCGVRFRCVAVRHRRKKAHKPSPEQPLTGNQTSLNKFLLAERHVVEYWFSKLKRFRRVATRYEKTARTSPS
ncbi:transposase [Bradyrhizobium sp. 182]|nr:transposase [Bradyrhizobium sp. CW12]MCK1527923.1 transposase [Bradyrhizobium sp. 182]MCK1649044.1 transposase [Bradyrhizobium sp. 154]